MDFVRVDGDGDDDDDDDDDDGDDGAPKATSPFSGKRSTSYINW